MADTDDAGIYEITIALSENPPIWRRLLVEDDTTLYGVHRIIQIAFDWDEAHPHKFVLRPKKLGGRPSRWQAIGDTRPGVRRFSIEDVEAEDESETALYEIEPEARLKYGLVYVYDFGDNWEHAVQIKGKVERDPQVRYPVCIEGKGMAPWEDAGGMPGWYYCLEARDDPNHPWRGQLEDWLGTEEPEKAFNPDHFDIDKVNTQLRAEWERARQLQAELNEDEEGEDQDWDEEHEEDEDKQE